MDKEIEQKFNSLRAGFSKRVLEAAAISELMDNVKDMDQESLDMILYKLESLADNIGVLIMEHDNSFIPTEKTYSTQTVGPFMPLK